MFLSGLQAFCVWPFGMPWTCCLWMCNLTWKCLWFTWPCRTCCIRSIPYNNYHQLGQMDRCSPQISYTLRIAMQFLESLPTFKTGVYMLVQKVPGEAMWSPALCFFLWFLHVSTNMGMVSRCFDCQIGVTTTALKFITGCGFHQPPHRGFFLPRESPKNFNQQSVSSPQP